MNPEIIWGVESIWFTVVVYYHTIQSDGIQFTLVIDVLDLRGGAPDSHIVCFKNSSLQA
jgi:hypothetical protein